MIKHNLLSCLAPALLALAVILAGCTGQRPVASAAPKATQAETPLPGGVLPQSGSHESAQSPEPPTQTIIPSIPPIPTAVPPTPTTAPAAVSSSCLVGSWQVTDLPQAMAQSFAQSQSDLKLNGVEGQTLYQFTPDGQMTITFNQLAANFTGTVDQRAVTAREQFNGSATAHYQLEADGQHVLLSNFGGEGIQFALDMNGQRLAEGKMPVWRAFTGGQANNNGAGQPTPAVQSSRALVTCSGDTLQITAQEPVPGQTINLQRVR